MESHHFFKFIFFLSVSSTIHSMNPQPGGGKIEELNNERREIEELNEELQRIFAPHNINGPETPAKIKKFIANAACWLKRKGLIVSPNNSKTDIQEQVPKKRSKIERCVSC